ncbi:hypothetical protein QVD17_35879 [Tagetes erecta]|uniref:RNA helicase n=1 Tax=Tagetes erecta TaxID=13708 RepID=A0AAD8NIL1_TARER|nr:hypothetical protein QVD17_35879 [Tagetes erecta]
MQSQLTTTNFVIQLSWHNNICYNHDHLLTLMGKYDGFNLYKTSAKFFYHNRSNALETMVHLWQVLLMSLDEGHVFTPNLVGFYDTDELNTRLMVVFKDRINGLMNGDLPLVKKLRNKMEQVSIHDSSKKEGSVLEKELIGRMIREFNAAMECMHDYLERKVFDASDVKVLMLKGAYDWNKIYWMIKRECRRLDEGLSIYADRTDILTKIHNQQVTVLIGETGSGKSTQLVQFLADSGVGGDKSIVCTQPRKLAAVSLANRVKEESHGCCKDNSVICSSTYSCFQQSDSKVIYMTDDCLLKHYMNDKNLSWASCIVVDEAHERSLNTDLLLAVMKDLLHWRSDIRLIIMSATANAQQLSSYFFGCGTHHVVGRTFPVPGKCYRVYGESDYRSMQEPEVLNVNLESAVLRILALGYYKVEEFDFIDAPSNAAIETAIKNLIQLGAIVLTNGVHKLTKGGRMLVKLGIEPRLGKMVLKCFEKRLGREGLVLVAIMANSSSIFCRGGSEEEKQVSDRLKVQFCHPDGDLFTLLSVYRKWEGTRRDKRNQWCWDNRINAKTMRRCHEAVQEMESCLKHELNIITPAYWCWNHMVNTNYDQILKDVILSALEDNIAMYSGNDSLGYEVVSTGAHVRLHPSCSLLMFSERPSLVVFREITAMPSYLVCVTSINIDSLRTLSPTTFDVSQICRRKLQLKVFTGLGTALLKRFCGKSNSSLKHLVSHIRDTLNDDRIRLEVSFEHNRVNLFATFKHMRQVSEIVNSALELEGKWIQNECIEKRLFPGRHEPAPVALLGSGAEIKYLELEKRCLTVDIFIHGPCSVKEKELLSFLEERTSGNICAFHKLNGDGQENEKWGDVTFLTPEAAEKATKLTAVEFKGCKLKIAPSRSIFGGDNNLLSSSVIKAKVLWPRRRSQGVAFVKCNPNDTSSMVEDFSNMLIRGKSISSRRTLRYGKSVMLSGLDVDLFEDELFEVLRKATDREIVNLILPRAVVVENPSLMVLEEALLREVSSFMPAGNECVRVRIFPCEPLDYFMKAEISFDGRFHLEAANALEQIDGKALPGCEAWQKIKCKQQFTSSVSCPASVYIVIKEQLHALLKGLQVQKGAEFFFDRSANGTCRVKISAKSTKTLVESRRPVEYLMTGKTITDDRLTPHVIQLIFSREGFSLQKSIQRETGTYFLIDRDNDSLRVVGPLNKLTLAENRLVESLVALYKNKQLDIHLNDPTFPPDLMKKVVEKFGPDLYGLKEKFPGSDFTLNPRNHIISIRGNEELKRNVIHEIVGTTSSTPGQTPSCPICLCDVEDGYRLENCKHEFCRSCLVEQYESAIRNSGSSFPIRCARDDCMSLILVVDIKALLSTDKLDELFHASIGSYVASSYGKYRFCPSPDCPSVYQVTKTEKAFACGACSVKTCSKCHLEYHPLLSCEKYKELIDPDWSLKEWLKGKEGVKQCPACMFTIEKIYGCNHVECRCGTHICWVCLEHFKKCGECYQHLLLKHGKYV